MSMNLTAIRTLVAKLWPRSGWTQDEYDALCDGLAKVPIDTNQGEAAISDIRRKSTYTRPDMPKLIAACWELTRKKVVGVAITTSRTVDIYRRRQEKAGIPFRCNEWTIVMECRNQKQWTRDQQFQHCVECLLELENYAMDTALEYAVESYPDMFDLAQAWLDRTCKPSHFRRKEKGVEA